MERYHVARALGLTLGQLDQMPVSEYQGWREYLLLTKPAT